GPRGRWEGPSLLRVSGSPGSRGTRCAAAVATVKRSPSAIGSRAFQPRRHASSTATPVYTTKDLGETVRRSRRGHRLTQIALAERAKVAGGAVQKLEWGRGTVHLPTVLKVLRTLWVRLLQRDG